MQIHRPYAPWKLSGPAVGSFRFVGGTAAASGLLSGPLQPLSSRLLVLLPLPGFSSHFAMFSPSVNCTDPTGAGDKARATHTYIYIYIYIYIYTHIYIYMYRDFDIKNLFSCSLRARVDSRQPLVTWSLPLLMVDPGQWGSQRGPAPQAECSRVSCSPSNTKAVPRCFTALKGPGCC
jgi:hypothetical protein